MLAELTIGPPDAVVEFAPGLGATARMALACNPATYTGIERDQVTAEQIGRDRHRPHLRVGLGAIGFP
jgi:16S rRNA A1518/A1519 N6-dimethyltransferase RsmA/KsgA/DIM1 with predicted DNA glycosylase/AP lyase activity